jgi:hypothetical protein
MIPIDQASSVLAEALGCKPLWTREVDGEVCYRIERFICRGRNLSHPPLAQPVLITHFGGKKVSTTDTRHYVVTYPSSTPWIKLRTEHLRLRAIIEEDRS